jgi:hypothetical protein
MQHDKTCEATADEPRIFEAARRVTTARSWHRTGHTGGYLISSVGAALRFTKMKLLILSALLATVLPSSFGHCKDPPLLIAVDGYDTEATVFLTDTFPDLYVNGTVTTDWQYVRMTANVNLLPPHLKLL